jgi:hypothetical protein
LKGEPKMKNEEEIHTAWTIWHLMARFGNLLWDRYEKEFVERYIKLEEEKCLESLSDKNCLSEQE